MLFRVENKDYGPKLLEKPLIHLRHFMPREKDCIQKNKAQNFLLVPLTFIIKRKVINMYFV